jgi:hypothetical protein
VATPVFFFLGLKRTAQPRTRNHLRHFFYQCQSSFDTTGKKSHILEQNLVESLQCTSGQNLQNGSHLIKKRSDPRFGVWPETQGNAPETVFVTFCECFFDSAFFLSPPRDRARRGLSKSSIPVP